MEANDKLPQWKRNDRALAARATLVRLLWDSSNRGTYNAGKNAAKRKRRAMIKAGAVA